jgi:dTDP-4-dehydrorhamnose 3,5-epimerase-like enzyme
MSDAKKLWEGLSGDARKALQSRDYSAGSLAERVTKTGVDAGDLLGMMKGELAEVWIPGVEIFARTIYPQRHRGMFGEFVRRDEGALAQIKLWPVQWSAARMFARTAKGFHIHPPHVPNGEDAEKWFGKLYVDQAGDYSLRQYDREQWDVMFFVQGTAEMILREARAGMPARTMRFFVDGDNHRGRNNVGVVVPPGVAHAIRAEGSEDVIMVYGTSVSFQPQFEGRVGSEIETAELPGSWQKFLAD